MPYDWIAQDGFEFAYDRFRTTGSCIERREPDALQKMFIPMLSREAKKVLSNNRDFVLGQLKHYGVDFDEKELTGNGTNLIKKFLKQGKLNKVPNHIEELKSQLATRWYNQLTLGEMADTHQEQLIAKYFLDTSGRPDRTKTLDVLTVPLPPGSNYRAGQLISAAEKVDGLHNVRRGDSLYLGWNQDAVADLANGHEKRLKEKIAREKKARDQERDSMTASYLQKARRSSSRQSWSPVGSYIVDCDEIEAEWPEHAEHEMTLDINPPDADGFFKAGFDFGVVEGIMILSSQKTALDNYGLSDEEDDENSEEDEDRPATGSKRKVTYKKKSPPKRAKRQNIRSKTLFLKWKGSETGEGTILYEAERGSITFKDDEYSKSTGKMDISFLGSNVPFVARKISGTAQPCGSWSDYSESAYERARISRWG